MFFFFLFLITKSSGAWSHLGMSTALVCFDEFWCPSPVDWDRCWLGVALWFVIYTYERHLPFCYSVLSNIMHWYSSASHCMTLLAPPCYTEHVLVDLDLNHTRHFSFPSVFFIIFFPKKKNRKKIWKTSKTKLALLWIEKW